MQATIAIIKKTGFLFFMIPSISNVPSGLSSAFEPYRNRAGSSLFACRRNLKFRQTAAVNEKSLYKLRGSQITSLNRLGLEKWRRMTAY
jgi:hypothetical protein